MSKSLEKWMITIAVISGCMVQLISTSSVNVALNQMMGNLGASLEDISWVVTAFTAANVLMITLSGWMSTRFGTKNFFIASIIIFTLASICCGISTNLPELIIFRIIQGLGGGGLMAVAQSILVATFPREELGMANAIYGMGLIIGPSIGPTLGGYITDNLSWHWVFFLNVPVGILATIMSVTFLKKSKHKISTEKMDWLSLVLLMVTIGGLQIVLSKGQTWDWFESNFITLLSITVVVAGFIFVIRQLKAFHPILNLRLLKNYQFAAGTFFSLVQGIGLYASVFIIPIFCQSLLGYTSQETGLIMLPGSLAAGIMMPVVALIMKKTKISPIALSGIGIILFLVFIWQLSGMNLNTNAGDFFIPLVIRGIGLGLLFIPLLTITIFPLHSRDVPQGSAISNMFRQLGGSFGIAVATTFLSIRSAFHYERLSEHVSIYNQTSFDRINAYTNLFLSKGSDFLSAQLKAVYALKGSMYKQVLVLTYNDIFLLVGFFFAICLPLLLLFRIKGKNAKQVEQQAEKHMVD
ncbi:MAG TPA: DHA2 family efflux MFS transporter permease subunit [Bacteroidales bacterium]